MNNLLNLKGFYCQLVLPNAGFFVYVSLAHAEDVWAPIYMPVFSLLDYYKLKSYSRMNYKKNGFVCQ